MNVKYLVPFLLILSNSSCETVPYYSGNAEVNTSLVNQDSGTCRDADGLSYATGQRNSSQICTVDLGMQDVYCLHSQNGLPFSITAKNVKFSNKSASCVRSKTSPTGGAWIAPEQARSLAIESLKNSSKINCDYLEHKPFYKYEIDLKRSVLDLHGGFTHEYELPITWKFSDTGELAVKVNSKKTDLTMKIQYSDGEINRGYEFSGQKRDDTGNWKVLCSIID
jgi:hypothetical protein